MAKPAAKIKTTEYRNYIDGKWVAPASNDYIENHSPADSRELIGRFPASSAEDVNRAVEAAAAAFCNTSGVDGGPWTPTIFSTANLLATSHLAKSTAAAFAV